MRKVFKAPKRKVFKAKKRKVFKVKSKRKVFIARSLYDDLNRWFYCKDAGNRTMGTVCIHREENWNKYTDWKKCRECSTSMQFKEKRAAMNLMKGKGGSKDVDSK